MDLCPDANTHSGCRSTLVPFESADPAHCSITDRCDHARHSSACFHVVRISQSPPATARRYFTDVRNQRRHQSRIIHAADLPMRWRARSTALRLSGIPVRVFALRRSRFRLHSSSRLAGSSTGDPRCRERPGTAHRPHNGRATCADDLAAGTSRGRFSTFAMNSVRRMNHRRRHAG